MNITTIIAIVEAAAQALPNALRLVEEVQGAFDEGDRAKLAEAKRKAMEESDRQHAELRRLLAD